MEQKDIPNIEILDPAGVEIKINKTETVRFPVGWIGIPNIKPVQDEEDPAIEENELLLKGIAEAIHKKRIRVIGEEDEGEEPETKAEMKAAKEAAELAEKESADEQKRISDEANKNLETAKQELASANEALVSAGTEEDKLTAEEMIKVAQNNLTKAQEAVSKLEE